MGSPMLKLFFKTFSNRVEKFKPIISKQNSLTLKCYPKDVVGFIYRDALGYPAWLPTTLEEHDPLVVPAIC